MSQRVQEILAGTPLPVEAGGKARGLQAIIAAGLRAPRAWVVLPDAPDEEIQALADDLGQSDGRLLAVRSSAIEEDQEGTSFAGIHQSLLGVRPDSLAEAVARVAASSLSERARWYRWELGLAPPSGPCAVVVQDLISSEIAGIALGVGESGDFILIEAVEGLGETAVDGRVTPERLRVVHEDGEWRVEHRTRRSQRDTAVVRADGVSRVPLLGDRRFSDVLEDAIAREIAEGVDLIQIAAWRALDVEWAWAGGTLWFLQARPRTRPLTADVTPGQTWSRFNVRELFPEIPSAFSRSTVGPAIDAAEREFLGKHGIYHNPSIPLFTFVHGRPVFNERILLVSDLLGVPRHSAQAEFGGSSDADDRPPELSLGKALRHPGILVRSVLITVQAERRARGFIARLQQARSELEALDRETANDHTLMQTFGDARQRIVQPWVIHAVSVAAAIANAQFPVLRALRRHAAPRAVLARLIADGEVSISTRLLDDLVALASAIRLWPGGMAFARTVGPELAAAQFWRKQLPPVLWTEVEGWLRQYGHRGPFESDLASPRYVEDLEALARVLFPLVLDGMLAGSADTRNRRRDEAMRARVEVEAMCGRSGRCRIERHVRTTKRLMILRELLRSEIVALFLPLRRMVLELGRRLVERGRLDARDDVWHLSEPQLHRASADSGFDARVAVARERARLRAWRHVEVPNRFTSDDVARMPSGRPAAASSASTLRGNGISPGVAEGHVCVLRAPEEAERFVSGAVLVAPAMDPAWTPTFARAVGVIVELGGALSHAGIVAREFGIPCVANVDGITRLVRDGDVVGLDGTSGLVTIVSRAGEGLHPPPP